MKIETSYEVLDERWLEIDLRQETGDFKLTVKFPSPANFLDMTDSRLEQSAASTNACFIGRIKNFDPTIQYKIEANFETKGQCFSPLKDNELHPLLESHFVSI